MPFKKGQSGNPAGKPPGPNKATVLLKDAIMLAATEAGGKEGLVGYLKQQAIKNPGAFLPLVAKVMPLQVVGEDGGPVIVVTGVHRAEDK